MEFQENMKNIVDQLSGAAGAKTVYGEPVHADGKIVIPVAKVAYAFGAGQGTAKNQNQEAEAGGLGGGGGLTARPIGVIEIAEGKTRFVPVVDTTRLIAAALAAFTAGIGLGRLIAKR